MSNARRHMPKECKQTRTLFANFYASGGGSIHITRESADRMAKEVSAANPRIACRQVAAMVGEGLGRAGPSRGDKPCG